jgi:prepilin-type N-terminal cleavage/methylation domain-containing protein
MREIKRDPVLALLARDFVKNMGRKTGQATVVGESLQMLTTNETIQRLCEASGGKVFVRPYRTGNHLRSEIALYGISSPRFDEQLFDSPNKLIDWAGDEVQFYRDLNFRFQPRVEQSVEQPESIEQSVEIDLTELETSEPSEPGEGEKGFALLEILIALSIVLVLVCMALPSMHLTMLAGQQIAAKNRVSGMYGVMMAADVCQTLTPGQCASTLAMIPAQGSIVSQNYQYTFTSNADGSWSYVATPLVPGLKSVSITNQGQLAVN